MSNTCRYCGLPKYEFGVRNCCEKGQAEEAEIRKLAGMLKQLGFTKTSDALAAIDAQKRNLCINPTCGKTVENGGYRKLGACCKEHNTYFCSKCFRPHSYTTKAGKDHLQYRSENIIIQRLNNVVAQTLHRD